ncbi:LysR family transcriptional regulator [Nonomuraea sp. NPDC050790]|uniref:LysR family transcriptional regulator n=1 Tax=Nonomuraea sp. NPDC050790 TaxID=3364371 RepID=UPI0037A44483
MELRDIEIFLTLADELHFGRTAERLRVSQARVSQAIKKQERRIGAALFDRTSRTVTLTPIGRRLRDDLQRAYDLIQDGIAHATATGGGLRGTLRLGVIGVLGTELCPVIDAFLERHPGCRVETSEFHLGTPFTGLRGGEVDVQLMWLPIQEPDLSTGPVALTEGRVLAVSSSSDLAGERSVSLRDLAGRTVPDLGEAAPEYWSEALIPRRTPHGEAIPRGQTARTIHETLTLVAAERFVSPLPAHVARYYTYPGVTLVPIDDAPPVEWAFVWPTTGHSAPLRAFVQTALDVVTRPIAPA